MLSLWCRLRGRHNWLDHPLSVHLDLAAVLWGRGVLVSINAHRHCTTCALTESRGWREWVPFSGDADALYDRVSSAKTLAELTREDYSLHTPPPSDTIQP